MAYSKAEPKYSPNTLRAFEQLCRGRECIAILSAPSICPTLGEDVQQRAVLFDVGPKCTVGSVKFCHFDHEAPLFELESHLVGRCDLVIAHTPGNEEHVVDKYMQVARLLAAPDGLIAITAAAEHEFYFAMCGLFSQRFEPKVVAGRDAGAQLRLYTSFGDEHLERENDEVSPGDESDVARSESYCSWSSEMRIALSS